MISVSSIAKTFKLYQSPADRLKEIILRRCYHKKFHALKNVSFEVREGETLGIVGHNGAGGVGDKFTNVPFFSLSIIFNECVFSLESPFYD